MLLDESQLTKHYVNIIRQTDLSFHMLILWLCIFRRISRQGRQFHIFSD
uniref:Uncharacterized protein n=1 Tax=Rhizophora mucronata TaxID=61149 RepID=A0A2P2NEF2_RHIMU